MDLRFHSSKKCEWNCWLRATMKPMMSNFYQNCCFSNSQHIKPQTICSMSQWLALISFRYTVIPEWMALIFSNQRHPRRSFDTTHIQVVLDASGMVSQLQLWYDSALRWKKTSWHGWLLWSLQFTQKPIPKHKVIYPSEIDMSSWGYERTI